MKMRIPLLLVPFVLAGSTVYAGGWTVARRVDAFATRPEAEQGSSVPVKTETGLRYRETGKGWHDRYVYVVELPASNLLVKVRVVYPDDRKRTTMVSQTQPNFIPNGECWTCGTEQQELGSGMMSGAEFELSGGSIAVDYVFHHRDRWLGIVVESIAGFGQCDPDLEPGAICSLEIAWKPEGSSFGPKASAPKLGAKRGRVAGLYWEDPVFAMCFGGIGGTDDAAYDREFLRGMDYFDWTGMGLLSYPTVWYNGSIYKSAVENAWPNGYRHHPAGFPRRFAERCAERGVRFVPQFAMSSLPSLKKDESLRTVNAAGEVATTPSFTRPPVINPLHPKTQGALEALVDEHLDMLADVPSFDGITFYLNLWSLAQLGCWLDSSYDDWTMEAFSKATGEALPGASRDSGRFALRAAWIREDAGRRQRFLGWRADRMTSFYERIGRKISGRKPDARLRLMLDIPNLGIRCISGGVFAKGPDTPESYLEMGLDLDRLATNANIRLDRVFDFGMVRNEEQYRNRSLMPHPFADLNPAAEMNKPLLGKVRGVTIHEFYFETHGIFARGNFMNMPPPWKKEAYGRCTAPLAPGREMLRYYAKALELFDPEEINIGGFTPGTHGAEVLIREWITAFKAIPRDRFTEERRCGDVLVRRVHAERAEWLYFLNTSASEASISLKLVGMVDAVTGERIEDGSISLRPFELKVFRR